MSTYTAKHKAFYERHRARLLHGMRQYREDNKEYFRSYICAYRATNKKAISAQKKAMRNNPEFLAKEKALNKAWREANPQRKETTRAAWMRANPEMVHAAVLRRRAALIQATPQWADVKKMAEFYAKATELTAQTGMKHNVDHIVPIQSRLVCGLHVVSNLRVIPKVENISKGNRSWPDMQL